VVNNIYFMYKGQVSLNLPKYNANYLQVSGGEMFGVIDIVYSIPSEVLIGTDANINDDEDKE